MVARDVGVLEHRRDLELARSHFVVTRSVGMPSLNSLCSESHMNAMTRSGMAPEVVVFELLTLGRLGTEQAAACGHDVRAL